MLILVFLSVNSLLTLCKFYSYLCCRMKTCLVDEDEDIEGGDNDNGNENNKILME